MTRPGISSSRLQFLDFLRGLAAVIMLQGHTFHSFARQDLREGSAYVLSQFVGGIPPALFLFLTGVTLAFRMDSLERRGAGAWARMRGALERSGYLIAVAFAFRVQLWLFSQPHGDWTDILKVDVLNCMALAILVMAPMAAFRTAERPRLAAVLGFAIAFASPVVSTVDWSGMPALARAYLTPDYNLFSFFPWAAFLAFGLSAGSALRRIPEEELDRSMQWAALLGAILVVGGRYFSDLPYSVYTKSEFWLNSPGLILIKLGIVLWMLTFAFLWTRYVAPGGWSWVRQLGTTSLLVYWVHIELVYGRWFPGWKESLDVTQTVWASLFMIGLMVALSTLKTRWSEGTLPMPQLLERIPVLARTWPSGIVKR